MNPNAAGGFYSAIHDLTYVTDNGLRDQLYEELLMTQRGLRDYYANLQIEKGPKRKHKPHTEVADAVAGERRV